MTLIRLTVTILTVLIGNPACLSGTSTASSGSARQIRCRQIPCIWCFIMGLPIVQIAGMVPPIAQQYFQTICRRIGCAFTKTSSPTMALSTVTQPTGASAATTELPTMESVITIPAAMPTAGRFNIYHWNNVAYRQYTYQVVNVRNGNYKLTAWGQSGGTNNCFVGVKNYGGAEMVHSPRINSSGWKQYTVPTVAVTNGHIEVLFLHRLTRQWMVGH